jgi:hypothetical protein
MLTAALLGCGDGLCPTKCLTVTPDGCFLADGCGSCNAGCRRVSNALAAQLVADGGCTLSGSNCR